MMQARCMLQVTLRRCRPGWYPTAQRRPVSISRHILPKFTVHVSGTKNGDTAYFGGGCSFTISRMHTAFFWVRSADSSIWMVPETFGEHKSTDHVMTKKTCDHKLFQSLLYHFWEISCPSTLFPWTYVSTNQLPQARNWDLLRDDWMSPSDCFNDPMISWKTCSICLASAVVQRPILEQASRFFQELLVATLITSDLMQQFL